LVNANERARRAHLCGGNHDAPDLRCQSAFNAFIVMYKTSKAISDT
jgi:hypothetical protein